MHGAVSLLAPTINSYRRMAGMGGGPHVAAWGDENKSVALRTISRAPSLARVEYRVACSDANPYLLIATVLAGGLAGLEESIEAPDEFAYFAWNIPDRVPHLPATITEAAEALQADERLGKRLGTEFVDYWINTRRWEWMMFHTSGSDPRSSEPTDWELTRYFEVV
jgi:glutamine synthetase